MPEISQRDQYLVVFGEAILSYNGAEAALRNLLAETVTHGIISIPTITVAQIMTAELGNLGLSEALHSYAMDVAPPELKDHIIDAAKYMDTLRGYRNFYVHGITVMVASVGYIQVNSAKSGLKEHKAMVGIELLEELRNQSGRAHGFINAVHNRLRFKLGSWPASTEPPLPDRPTLPKPIQKPSRYWRE